MAAKPAKTPNTRFTTKKIQPMQKVIIERPKRRGQKYKPLSAVRNKYNMVVPYANVVRKVAPLEGVKRSRKKKN